MKQEQKSHLFGQFKYQVRSHIDDNFTKYNQEVQRKNQDHSGATHHKNDMAGKIYSSLQEVARELSTTPPTQHSSRRNSRTPINSEGRGGNSTRGKRPSI